MSLHDLSTGTFVPMLKTLSQLLDKAAEQAAARQIDLAALPEARLAPDMYPLTKQVQIACDQAKDATARLTGQTPPRFPDEERTLDELKARIGRTIDYVESAPDSAFAGAGERAVLFPLIEDLVFDASGFEYLRDWALPNFYFHIVTAYDILRRQGVEIGKRDYLGNAAGPHIHPKA
ncbi:MAG TPA: DUF1993 domain-containing protein [Stellaceae bacterium]|nr:DUF1993 domain-containing protein [Stellaceae bacterium]